METLIKLLSDRKIAPPKNLTEVVKGYGYEPDKLTSEQAQMVADELTKQQGAIAAPPKAPKPNGNGKPPQTGTNVEGLQRSMMESWGKQEANLTAFTGRLEQRKQTVIVSWVETNYQIINSTSQDAVDALARKLQEVESDPETFLGLADRIPEQFSVVNQ